MAHWAGTGPTLATCRQCQHWASIGKWFEDGPGGSGEPMPSRCRRYKSLGMLKTFGPPIPHSTPSCAHYTPAKKPQPLKRPERVEADWLA